MERKPIVIGPPKYQVRKCVDCGDGFCVEKERKDEKSYVCTDCEGKLQRDIRKRKTRRERYQKAKAKMLKRNPRWPGR